MSLILFSPTPQKANCIVRKERLAGRESIPLYFNVALHLNEALLYSPTLKGYSCILEGGFRRRRELGLRSHRSRDAENADSRLSLEQTDYRHPRGYKNIRPIS